MPICATTATIVSGAMAERTKFLAGLVAITAGCDVTDALGSIVIGAVSGVLVAFGVWLLGFSAVAAWTVVTITVTFLISL